MATGNWCIYTVILVALLLNPKPSNLQKQHVRLKNAWIQVPKSNDEHKSNGITIIIIKLVQDVTGNISHQTHHFSISLIVSQHNVKWSDVMFKSISKVLELTIKKVTNWKTK